MMYEPGIRISDRKRNVLPWVLFFIACAVIVFMQMCRKEPAPPPPVVNVDSLETVISEKKAKITADSIAYLLMVKKYDSAYAVWMASKARIETVASKKIVELTFERNKLRTALLGRDTVGAIEICERFAMLYDSAIGLVGQYKATIDSLQSLSGDRKLIDSLQIAALYEAVNGLQRQVDFLLSQIKDLVATNALLRTQLARSKKGKKWLLILGLAAGSAATGAVLK